VSEITFMQLALCYVALVKLHYIATLQ